MLVQNTFRLNYVLHYVNATRNSQKVIKILDVDYLTVNLNDLLVIESHLKSRQDLDVAIGAYAFTLNFLKDYVVEF